MYAKYIENALNLHIVQSLPMTRWHPLLQGDDAERTWAVIGEIAEALRPEVEKIGPESDPCFAGGTSGLATFYA